jgi:hypothetical protein
MAGGGTGAFSSLITTDIESEMNAAGATTAYVRIPFTLTSQELADITALTLKMKFDDGYVAYLNGVEISSQNAPGSPAWNSTATAERNDVQASTWSNVDATAHIGELVVGDNVLAIQGLNYSIGDGDMLILPELVEVLYTGLGEHYFAIGTPGAENTDEYWLYVADTQFSHDRGFYEAAFDLEITSDTVDADIYYTTDSSEPSDTNGTLYTAPITISTTTSVRAKAYKANHAPTNIDTQTYIFLDDVVNQPSDPAGFDSTWGSEPADYEMDPNITSDPFYADTLKNDLKSIPTMSIVMDYDNMFGSGGIYSNPTAQGELWEHAASLEYFDPTTGDEFQINAGARIYGGVGRYPQFKKHSFRLLFKEDYGPTKLDFPLFGEGAVEEFDTIILRSNFNDAWVWGGAPSQYIRDEFAGQLQNAMGDAGRHGTFVHLYINGLYWGLYNPVERPDTSFSASYYGGDKDNWDGINSTQPTGESQTTAWNYLMAQSPNLGDDVWYQRIQGNDPDGTNNPAYEDYLDIDQYINYMLLNQFGGNNDWVSHNWYAGRMRGADSTGFKAYSWDAEWTVDMRSGLNENTVNDTTTSNYLIKPYSYLKNNAEFQMRYADHVHRHMFNGGVLTPESTGALYQGLADFVEQSIKGEAARWGDVVTEPGYDLDDWTNERDYILNTYMPQRTGIVLQQLKNAGLYPNTDAPSFNIEGAYQHGGTVNLGDALTIDAPAGSIYFTTDGTDPRPVGGGAPDAGDLYTAGVALAEGTHVKARVYDNGEWSALNEATFYIDLAPDIRITEIMYNPSDPTAAEILAGHDDSDDFEFIEIKNISASETLPLAGLRLSNGINFTFGDISIAPGDYVVVVSNQAAFQYRYSTFSGVIAGEYGSGIIGGTQLSNGGEKVELESPIGGIIHDFNYSDGWYEQTDGEGFSLTIRDPQGVDTLWDQKIGWRASADPDGTPGSDDVLATPGSVIINEILAHSDTPYVDTIELYNAGTASVDISGWWLSDSSANLASYQIPSMAPLAPGAYVVFYGDTDFGGDFLLSEHGEDLYLSSNSGGAAGGYREHVDFGASPNNVSIGLHTKSTGGTDFTILSAHTFGSANADPYFEDLVINEVMYHPPAATAAEITAGFINDDDFEFVELYNTSGSALTVTDYYMSSGIGFTAGWYDADGDNKESWTLEPGATATWNASLTGGLGTYEVFARWDLLDALGFERGLDGQAQYAITHDSGTTVVVRDQKPELDDEGPGYIDVDGWVSLGSYAFNGSGQVVLTRGTNNPGNWTIADNVKFVRAGFSDVVVDNPTLDSWYTSNGPATIAPGQRVVIVSNYAAFDERYDIAGNGITVLGEYTGSLSNTGDAVKLQRSGTPDPGPGYYIPYYRIDYVNYNDKLPWPVEADGAGYTMIRDRLAGPVELYGNDPASWSAGSFQGTPGSANVLIDPSAPTVPASLTPLVAVTPTRIDLSWTASTDAESGVDHYVIYRNGVVIGTTTSASFSDTTAAFKTEYSYQVSAVNGDQFESALSAAESITIPGPTLVEIPNDTIVRLVFNEALVEASAENTGKYAFSGGAVSQAVLTAPNTVELTVGTLTIGQAYTVTVDGITTISGLLMPDGQQLGFEYRIAEGTILREYWTGIGTGNAVSDLESNGNYPDNPTRRNYPTSFEAPQNWADAYGTRMRGYLHPTVSGMYTFSIASDDSSELHISTDTDPANMTRVSYLSGSTGWRNWTAQSSQQSDPIYLSAGQTYYIEALHKEGSGGDHVSVAWKLDAGSWNVIPGANLSPYRDALVDNTGPTAPTGVTATPASSTKIDLSWVASTDAESGVSYYVVYRDGIEIGTSATTSFSDTGRSQTQSYTYSVSAVNGDDFEGLTGAAAPATPLVSIQSAATVSATQLLVTFGKNVTEATAEVIGNYSVTDFGGAPISVVSAVWNSGSADEVMLTLGQTLGENVIYRVSIINVEDTQGQAIEPGAAMQFVHGGLHADMLAWWTFDVDSGEVSHDLTANNRDMTVTGDVQWSASGQRGGAYQFDGSSTSYLLDEDAESYINGLGAYTFAAWIKADSLGSDMGWYTLRSPNTGDEYGFRHDGALQSQSNAPNGYRTGVRATGGTQYLETPTNTQTTDWVHVAMTWASGQDIKVYIDGYELAPGWMSTTVSGTIKDTQRLFLGRGPRDSNSSWSGLMDDVRIYGAALSQPEIISLVDPKPFAVEDNYDAVINRTLTVPASGVLLNDFDPDPGPAAITADLVSDVSHGVLALASDGSFVYTPTPGYLGPDSFTYRAYDGDAYGLPATVNLSVVEAVTIVSIEAIDATHVDLLFSADLDETIAETVGNYAADNGLSITSATLGGDLRTVSLVVTPALVSSQTYTFTVNNIEDTLGDPITPNTQVQLIYMPIGEGTILREWWLGISGGLSDFLNNANYPENPSGWNLPTSFEAPTNWADNYGTRMRGYIHPPETGNYTFWIASDDASELRLSTNEDPANAVVISYITGWTPSRQWFNNPSQESVEIPLVAGQRYYIEAVQKEGGGGDNLAVAWELPDSTFEGPIPGIRLSPWVESTNNTPTVDNPIANVTVDEDASNSVLDLSNVFDDIESPVLTLNVQSNSNPGLVGTSLVGDSLTLSYTPDGNGAASITIRATDSGGKYVDDTFVVTVNAVNDAPTVVTPISNVTVDEDASDTVIDLSAVFGDIDSPAPTLTVQANTNSGLVSTSLVGTTLTLSYAADASGSADITIRGTDTGGEEVDDTFTVTVNAVNDAPTVENPIGDVVVDEDASDTVIDLSSVFDDIDSPAPAVGVQANTNSGLVSTSLVGTTLTLSYAADASGTADITIRGTDTGGEEVDDTFTVTVNAVNDAPTVENPIGDVVVDEDASDTVIDLSSVFDDIDSPVPAVSVHANTNSSLVSTSLVGTTLTLSYAADASGTADITIRGTDTGGEEVDDTFTVTVNAVNDAPTVENPIGDVVVDEDASDTVIDLSSVFDDIDSPAPTVSVQANTNSGLVGTSLVGTTLTLSYAADASGSADITIRGTDTGGEEVDDTFTVTVNAVNDAPTVENPIGDVVVDEDASDTVIDLSAVFDDIDSPAPALTVQANTNSGLVSTSLVGTTLTLSYAADASGTANITIRGTDTGGEEVDDTFTVTVNAVNDAPTVENPIGDVVVDEDASDTVINLSSVFDDIDSPPPALTVQSNTNSSLVSTSLVGTTLTLSYAADASGSADITIRGTDTGGEEVDDTFTVTVNAVNDAPTVENPIGDVVVDEDASDTVIDLSAVFDDIDSPAPALTVQANTNSGLVSTSLVGTTLTLSYAADASGTADITIRGTDTGGEEVDDTFTVTVNAVNDAPTVENPIGDVVVDEDASDTVIDLSSVFDDIDSPAPVVSVHANTNSSLVSTSLVGTTLTLSYAADASGSADITIRGTDTGGEEVDDTFTVTVNAVNDAPTVENPIGDVVVDEDASDTVINLSSVFDDIDSPAPALTVQANTNSGLVSTSLVGTTLTLSYAADASGTADITIRGTDTGGEEVDDTFTVTVNAVNDAPTVENPIGDVVVDEDASDTVIDLSSVFSDIETPSLTLTVHANTNSGLVGASIVGTTLTLSYAPGANGTADITIRATDGGNDHVDDVFTVTVNAAANATIVNQHVFYNNSRFDANNAAANASDDIAIAPDKTMLLPGQKATFANYTSYSKGINGLMIDIDGMANPPAAGDFVFRAGNNYASPDTWAIAPAPSNDIAADVRSGAGSGGSDRVTLIWADGAIAKKWLQVTILSDANGGNLGLAENVVFYVGNAIGETGNLTTNAIVNATDEIAARNNPAFFPPATTSNIYDFNRDKLVNATDQIIARNNNTFFDALKLITAPAAPPAGAPAAAPAPAIAPESFESAPSVVTDPMLGIDLPTVDVLAVDDVSAADSSASTETIVQDDAAERFDVLHASDTSESGDGELEIDLLADMDPLQL